MSNILIVDDEQSYRQLLTLVFESDGHSIRTAANGREAVELVKEEAPDVIVSDVRMPDMDGIEMLRAVRETHADLGDGFFGECMLKKGVVGGDLLTFVLGLFKFGLLGFQDLSKFLCFLEAAF